MCSCLSRARINQRNLMLFLRARPCSISLQKIITSPSIILIKDIFFLSKNIKDLHVGYWKIIESDILILFLLHWVSAESFEKTPDRILIIVIRQWGEIAGMMDLSFDRFILNQVLLKTHSEIMNFLNLNILNNWWTELELGSWMNLWAAKMKMLKYHQNFGHSIQMLLLQKDLTFLIWAGDFYLIIIWRELQIDKYVECDLINCRNAHVH